MSQPIRILHLEDNPADALLVRDLFAEQGLVAEIKEADCKEKFIQAFNDGKWDLVLSDFRLKDFNGLEVLRIVREKDPLLPFILLSGTIGELAAIESLKAGATDYVLKSNRERLVSAVRRAVTESVEHQRLQAAEEDLRRSEKQYR